MAIRRPVNIKCPQCEKESTFSMWQNINSLEDPMLKQQILDGTLFDFKCPYCEYNVAMYYDITFNMPEHGVMLHMIADPEHAKKVPAAIEEHENMLPLEAQKNAKAYIHRVVPDLITLREKTLIFEAQLDDRVLELMKVIYNAQLKEQKGVEAEHIFFAINNQNGQVFEFYGESELIAIAPLDMNLYKTLLHAPQKKLKPIRNDRQYFVDQDWAINSAK